MRLKNLVSYTCKILKPDIYYFFSLKDLEWRSPNRGKHLHWWEIMVNEATVYVLETLLSPYLL